LSCIVRNYFVFVVFAANGAAVVVIIFAEPDFMYPTEDEFAASIVIEAPLFFGFLMVSERHV